MDTKLNVLEKWIRARPHEAGVNMAKIRVNMAKLPWVANLNYENVI